MLGAILEMSNYKDFLKTSCRLLTASARSELYHEISDAGYVLLLQDLWEEDRLIPMVVSEQSVVQSLKETTDDEVTAKIVHRLQLLGKANPGLEKYLYSYLSRACV